jgi:aspartyl-tRNA(Asn)/glutamyl-tRNA(Gln) amidotransferase subunit B
VKQYRPMIGIETHAQLQTSSKMFCGCALPTVWRSKLEGAAVLAPNTMVCPVCLGLPGSLPVANQAAVEQVIEACLALNCDVSEFSRFDRKNYHYPDLVKGYQISQFHYPLGRNGWLDISVEGMPRRIGISDVHLEEDTGKLVHLDGQTLIDFNRSGVPLMEIVSAPDLIDIDEVREFVLELRRILRYLGVNSGNMEEGAMRFEANVSVRPVDSSVPGTRVEVKNLNSFRALLRSIDFEIARQSQELEQGREIQRETRGWAEGLDSTYVQRSKEMADDYRYFPEPDLPPLKIEAHWIEDLRTLIPELPAGRRLRFVAEYGLTAEQAGLLTEDRAVADYYEQAAQSLTLPTEGPNLLANWVTGELFHLLHEAGVGIEDAPASPEQLAELLCLLHDGVINVTTAKRVLGTIFQTGQSASIIVARQDLAQVVDESRLAGVVDSVISDHPQAVADYRGGKETVLRFLVGQVMKATQGRADAKLVAEILREKLQET